MTKLTPYLFFQGHCREAMEFYQKTFGGDLEVMTYGSHMPDLSEPMKSSVMHSRLSQGTFVLMASDAMKDGVLEIGTNVRISAAFDSVDTTNKTFASLAVGGTVVDALQDAFWGERFGIVKDRFGIQWLFTCPLK